MAQRNHLTRAEVIVLACCAVLALLALVAVRQAGRRSDSQQACLSNVQALTRAWLMYTNEHAGALVSAQPERSSGWVCESQLSPAMPTLEQKLDAIRRGDLFSYVGDLHVYHCPADLRLNDPNQLAFDSYSIAGGANGVWGDDYGYVACTRYAEIRRPSSKYVFVEEPDPRGHNMGSWEMRFTPLRWEYPLAMWHRDSTTLGFADGHADAHRWRDQSLIDWCGETKHQPTSFKFVMTPPEGETRDIGFMRNGFPSKFQK